MQLGTILENLANEGSAADALTALGDLVLYTRVVATAERYAESPGAYVAGSVDRFAAAAGDEAWVGLLGAMERSDDPARAALRRMLQWSLDIDGSSS